MLTLCWLSFSQQTFQTNSRCWPSFLSLEHGGGVRSSSGQTWAVLLWQMAPHPVTLETPMLSYGWLFTLHLKKAEWTIAAPDRNPQLPCWRRERMIIFLGKKWIEECGTFAKMLKYNSVVLNFILLCKQSGISYWRPIIGCLFTQVFINWQWDRFLDHLVFFLFFSDRILKALADLMLASHSWL